MSSATPPPAGPPGQHGRPRPARTIELDATEIASEPVAPTPAAAEMPEEEPAAMTSASVESPPSAKPEEPAPETGSSPLAENGSRPEADIGAPAGSESPAAEGPSADARTASPGRGSKVWPPRDGTWRLIGVGVAGAVLTLAVVMIGGRFTARDNRVSALDARLARAEQELRDLSARPLSASVEPRTVNDLADRIARLEGALATPRPAPIDPALANRIATVEGEVKALAERIGVLARRSDEIAAIAGEARQRAESGAAALTEALQKLPRPGPAAAERAEVEALANRVATLERSLNGLESELSRRVASEAGDRAVRLAVVATALAAAVERGDPFAAELAMAKSLAADPKPLVLLEPFADSGLPSAAVLGRELSALVPALARAAGVSTSDGSFLQRLQANAEKIVRIRPVEDVPSDDPAAIVARVEARTTRADFADALAELAKLPVAARAPAQTWSAKVETRLKAVELCRRFAAEALAALGKTSP